MEAQKQPLSEECLQRRREQEAKRAALVLELALQRVEAESPANVWYSGEEHHCNGYDLTPEQRFTHYNDYGGTKGFRERLISNPPPPEVMARHKASLEKPDTTNNPGT
jgi:hypothetical protein